jgi:hypothetical protein
MTDASDPNPPTTTAPAGGMAVETANPKPDLLGVQRDPTNAQNVQEAAASLNLALAVPLALDVGRTMATLYGYLPPGSSPPLRQLPTLHELAETERIDAELVRLESLLNQLSALMATKESPHSPDISNLKGAWPLEEMAGAGARNLPVIKSTLEAELLTFNLELLESLACASRELELAYQLGRSLRDTANPPIEGERTTAKKMDALKAQLARQRVSKLQQWLATLTPHLPANAAAVVGSSLGKWSNFRITTLDPDAPGQLVPKKNSEDDVAVQMFDALLDQGDIWLNLLTGTESTVGLLTPESYVAAGEAALSRTARIIKRMVFHYWFALMILAFALAGVLTISAVYLGGASKVWTLIAAISGALGVTAKGIGGGVSRLSEQAARPIYRLEEIDAMAWAVTTLPEVDLNHQGVRILRRNGIEGTGPLGHILR